MFQLDEYFIIRAGIFAVRRVLRCPWLAAVFCQQSLTWQLGAVCCGTRGSDELSAGLSVTHHTEILQNKIMQTGVELQPFNVHTFVTHLANVFPFTQMYE